MTTPDRIRLTQAGGNGRPLTVAVLLLMAIGVSLLKPWAGAAVGTPESSTTAVMGRPAVTHPYATAAPATAAPTGAPSPAPASNSSGACYYGLAWRLFTTDTTNSGLVHTWYGLQPVPAEAPADASIPVIEVHSDTLRELGYCPTTHLDGQVHVLATHAWQLLNGADPRPLDLQAATRTAPANRDQGTVYLPPSTGSGPPPEVWARAVYVFAVRFGTSPVTEEWFAVRIG